MKNLPKIGELVVVNDLPDATLYRVVETQGKFGVGLIDSTYSGSQSTQWIDICYLQKPSKQQLANSL